MVKQEYQSNTRLRWCARRPDGALHSCSAPHQPLSTILASRRRVHRHHRVIYTYIPNRTILQREYTPLGAYVQYLHTYFHRHTYIHPVNCIGRYCSIQQRVESNAREPVSTYARPVFPPWTLFFVYLCVYHHTAVISTGPLLAVIFYCTRYTPLFKSN